MSQRQQASNKTAARVDSVALEVGDPDEIRLVEESAERERKTRSSMIRIFRRHPESSDSDSNPNGDLAFETDETEISNTETFFSELRDYIAVAVDSNVTALLGCLLALLDFFFFITWFVFLLEDRVPKKLLKAYKSIDWVTAVAFLSESLLRFFAYGPQIYFRSPVRSVDMVISLVNFAAVLALHLSTTPPTWLRAAHLVRLLRIVMNMAKVRERALKWRARAELNVLQQQLAVERSEQGRLAKWRIDSDAIALGESAGSGAFGAVNLGLFRGTLVAVKQLFHTEARANAPSIEDEAITLVDLRHPNVVLFMGFVHEPGRLWIVTEYCSRGSLRDVLDNTQMRLTHARILKFALGAARGLAYLHGQQPCVLHRDLKPSNILLTSGWDVKLADFGLARRMDSRPAVEGELGSGFAGTMQYCAPEIFSANEFGTAADVYAFAICLWEMAARDEPFRDKMQVDIMYAVAQTGERPRLSMIQNRCDLIDYETRKANNYILDSGTLAMLRSIGSSEIELAVAARNSGPILATARSNGSAIGMISSDFSSDSSASLKLRSPASSTGATMSSVPRSSSFSSGAPTNLAIGRKSLSVCAPNSEKAAGGKLSKFDEELDQFASPLTIHSPQNTAWSDISPRRELDADIASDRVGRKVHRNRAKSSTFYQDSSLCRKKFSSSEAVELGARVQRMLDLDDDNGVPSTSSYTPKRRSASERAPTELEKAATNISIGEQIAQYRALRQLHEYEVSELNEVEALLLSETGRFSEAEGRGAVAMCTEYCELIEQCWSQDPKDRPSADELVWRLISMINAGIQGDHEVPEAIRGKR